MDREQYAQWVNNEYWLWVEALQCSSVHNFKDHPQVQRMLSTDLLWASPVPDYVDMELITRIDQIGYGIKDGISGAALRMIYYADKVLHFNPSSIVEIGGGVGEFYAILRAMGYKGTYWIYDLPEISKFQYKYLTEVIDQTGLDLTQRKPKNGEGFCVSFYALGEFDDDKKKYYVKNVVNKCPHGFVVWNPHSGATEDIPFECTVIPQAEGTKLLLW